MNRKLLTLTISAACVVVLLLVLGVAWGIPALASWIPTQVASVSAEANPVTLSGAAALQKLLPTPTAASAGSTPPSGQTLTNTLQSLTSLYQDLNRGVVHIQVFIARAGQTGEGSGSGFILDTQGHIVTNNHVVADANEVVVVFSNGWQSRAKVVGRDAYSDLAVIQVDKLPTDVHPLPLGNSDATQAGEWVIAIGSPFGLGSSMTVGVVSAVGRAISSGVSAFSIPQAIQTDAAINPGNSGGPLINLEGKVIGVNAQIASNGAQANAGVGFAIPANVVQRVAPILIAQGSMKWPWLGIEGTSVNLFVQEANGLDTQQGAYIQTVVANGPAAKAGLRGSTGTRQIDGFGTSTGGDVVIAIDGKPVRDFNDLLAEISLRDPGDQVSLTVLRNKQQQQLTVTLEARPAGGL